MRHQQFAMFAGQLLHALVGVRIVVERLHLLLLPLGGVAHQRVGGLPCVALVLAADDLQPHAEADVVLAAVAFGHGPDLVDVGADPLRQVAPEQMHVGMLRRDLPGLARAAAEIEFRIRLLQRPGPDMRAGQFCGTCRRNSPARAWSTAPSGSRPLPPSARSALPWRSGRPRLRLRSRSGRRSG